MQQLRYLRAIESRIDSVRRRPGMYLDAIDAAHVLALEVVANALDQHLAGRCARIAVKVERDGTIEVADDGPGISAAHLDPLFTEPSDRPTTDGHRPHAHLGAGGLGLWVVCALSEWLEVVTVCAGIEARATYGAGRAIEPVTTRPSDRASGTAIRFRVDSTVLASVRPWRGKLSSRLEELSYLAPGLALSWSFAPEAAAAGGMAAWLASRHALAPDQIAAHRGRYASPRGPIDVDVAVICTMPSCAVEPRIDGFVNYARSGEGGTHVDGVLLGVRRFFRARRRCNGVIGAVAVVLANVHGGTPTGDQLWTRDARGSVAEATTTALARWAEAHGDAVAALRAYHRAR
ncbi:MAG: ATP-binding protein [Kofleriaceae bacterium]